MNELKEFKMNDLRHHSKNVLPVALFEPVIINYGRGGLQYVLLTKGKFEELTGVVK